MCVCVCVCVYIYIYIYIKTESLYCTPETNMIFKSTMKVKVAQSCLILCNNGQ